MTNTSATGGPLLPTADSPVYLDDAALDAFLQGWLVGITGLSGTLVRPRWQTSPPAMPERTVDWLAFGITEMVPDANAAFIHHSGDVANPNGYDEERRHEVDTLLCTFYGPDAGGYCRLLRDGLWVSQNREPLLLAGMGLVDVGPMRQVPELINRQWYRRYDMQVRIRRITRRFYAVLNILEGVGIITKDVGVRIDEPWDSDNATDKP
jgi:hypothetical protein